MGDGFGVGGAVEKSKMLVLTGKVNETGMIERLFLGEMTEMGTDGGKVRSTNLGKYCVDY